MYSAVSHMKLFFCIVAQLAKITNELQKASVKLKSKEHFLQICLYKISTIGILQIQFPTSSNGTLMFLF